MTIAPEAPAAEAAPELELTVEELSARTGTKISTLRFYQQKGVLMPPRRAGRIGLYGQAHLDRLTLIDELRDKGLSLDAIRKAIKLADDGGPEHVAEWLGLGERLSQSWVDDRPQLLSSAQVDERLAGRRRGLKAALIAGHTLVPQGPADFVVPSPALLDLALELDAAGIDTDVANAAQDILRRRLAKAAEELLTMFAGRAGTGFGRSATSNDVAVALDELRARGPQAVALIFAQEMEKALRAYVASGDALNIAKLLDNTR